MTKGNYEMRRLMDALSKLIIFAAVVFVVLVGTYYVVEFLIQLFNLR